MEVNRCLLHFYKSGLSRKAGVCEESWRLINILATVIVCGLQLK